MNKPTLEEQIASFSVTDAGKSVVGKAMLASLKELQSIRSAELPAEPALLVSLRNGMSINNNPNILDTECDALLKHIDALKAYALKEKERADGLQKIQDEAESILFSVGDITCANGHKHKRHDGCLYCLAEKAESELAALRSAELPVEPERLRIPFNDTEIWKSRNDWIIYARELQSALQRAQEERDEWERKAGQYMDERDKAEAELAALRGRLMDLDAKDWLDTLADADKAMTAVILKEGK